MEWISVKHRYPIQVPQDWETLDWVLVTTDIEPQPVTIARWCERKWEFLDSDDSWTYGAFSGDCTAAIDSKDITHWMPLPHPPAVWV